jgi:hypothetical protein
MWSALDWTGILTSSALAPQEEDAQKSFDEKLKDDNDSDTGGETDTAGGLKDSDIDTDSDGEILSKVKEEEAFKYKRTILLLVAAMFAFAIFGGAFGGKKAEEGDETRSNLEGFEESGTNLSL